MQEDSLRLVAAFFVLVVPGVGLIIYSFRLLNGKGKKGLFMTDHIYSGRVYTGIPLGVALICFALAGAFETAGLVFIYIGGVFGLIGVIFAFIQPSFLKPFWLKWLEREHDDMMPLLRKEANEMGLNTWNERIQTQEDLEEWVEEVRRKYGL